MPFDLGAFRRSVLTDPLVYDIWDQKYRLKRPDGGSDEVTVDDTRRRVVEAVYAQDPSQEEKGRALRMVLDGYLVPAGRVNAGAGTGRNVTLGNCLAPEERLFTYEYGLVRLDSVAGQQVTVLTQKGWEPAYVRGFGEQVLGTVVLKPAHWHPKHGWKISPRGKLSVSIRVTESHRWVLQDGSETTRLKAGDVVAACSAAVVSQSPGYLGGFRHGIVFGDGSLEMRRPRTGFDQYGLRLCGPRKRALLYAFEMVERDYGGRDTDATRATVNRTRYENGDLDITYYATADLKTVPPSDSPADYVAGFIAGWCATDGYYKPDGTLIGVCTSSREEAEWLVSHAPLGGLFPTGFTSQYRERTNLSDKPSTIYKVTLSKQMAWKVESVEKGSISEPVFCAVVPGSSAFTLSSGIYTGNCYVLGTVMDSLPGIQRTISEAAFTMQQGGGVGVDYSTIRPRGALVGRTCSISSGIIPFADQQSAMCETIVSAGTRRGAMMLVLRDDHPDLWNPEQFETMTDYSGRQVLRQPSFISVKRQKGRLTQFNVSVLVSAAFMRAVEEDAEWDLGFHVPRADGNHVAVIEKPFPYDYYDMDNDGSVSELPSVVVGEIRPWYVYRRVPARRIWDDIMRSTYTYAEPGVIFIDRVNERNNLRYCETISATNPCAEQPLPPYGMCDLASLNLAFMVDAPFTPDARLNIDLLADAARVGVRFLDNVLDVTNYPLAQQCGEAMAKRRIGLGITGWGDALLQLGVPYGSPLSVELSRDVARVLQIASYSASAELAKERGTFPRFDRDAILDSFNVKGLTKSVRAAIAKHGLRNGVINTVAPNGTISIYSGNVSSGIEPVFSFDKVARKVRQADGSLREYESVDYAYRLYEAIHGPTSVEKLPSQFVGAMDISASEHVAVLAAWQQHIDASISKTINCAPDMSFEDFQDVYRQAYETGCKGCTTYRPDPASGRGSVLSVVETKVEKTASAVPARPRRLDGSTYKIKWPLTGTNWYVTVTRNTDGIPLELFITTRDVQHLEWVQALSCMATAILRRRGDVQFLVQELKQVSAATGFAFLQVDDAEDHPVQYPSVVAAIGGVLEAEWKRLSTDGSAPPAPEASRKPVSAGAGECPKCGEFSLIRENGCKRCLSCGYEQCG